MKHNQKAFTLIELLVVVLIIGILAAIALPQYEKAVVKARLATIKPIIASIKQAEEIYYMANQKYTGDENELDINLSCEKTNDPSVFVCGDFFVLDLISGTLAPDTSVIAAYYCSNKVTSWPDCTSTDKEFIYRVWLDYSSYPNKTQCTPATVKGTKLCNML